MADAPVYLTTKRKRGRPRKDGNLYRDISLQSPVNNSNVGKNLNFYKHDNTFEGIVGKTVFGVIEGSFDAGYLISVKTANSCIPFRGVVFHSEKVIPVTSANDIAPKAKLYQRREISVPVYNPNPQSQFSNTPPISPCGSNSSVTPYVFGGSPAFSVPVPRIVSCPNLGTNGVSRLGVNNKPQFPHVIDTVGRLEHDELMLGANMNMASMASTRDSSYKAIISGFTGNGVSSDLGSSVLRQNNIQGSNGSNFMASSPRPTFGTQQNGMVVNRGGWQREVQAIQSDMELKNNLYHCEMNNLDLNFHQNLFTNQSQQDQPGTNFHQVDFVNDSSRCQSLNSPLASVMQENKPLQEPADLSEAAVETSYLAPDEFKSSNPFWQSLKDETSERYVDQDATSLPEAGPLFNLETANTKHEPGRQQAGCSTVSITDFDYVMSDVVPSSESLSFHSQVREQGIHDEANGFQFLWKNEG